MVISEVEQNHHSCGGISVHQSLGQGLEILSVAGHAGPQLSRLRLQLVLSLSECGLCLVTSMGFLSDHPV